MVVIQTKSCSKRIKTRNISKNKKKKNKQRKKNKTASPGHFFGRTLRASCRPSSTCFLSGSVSFFRSPLAFFRAASSSLRISGSRPGRSDGLTNRFPDGVLMYWSGFSLPRETARVRGSTRVRREYEVASKHRAFECKIMYEGGVTALANQGTKNKMSTTQSRDGDISKEQRRSVNMIVLE